jgi:hypothetical protein
MAATMRGDDGGIYKRSARNRSAIAVMSFELVGEGQGKDPPDPCGKNGYTWIDNNKNNITKTGCECASKHAGSRFLTKKLCDSNLRKSTAAPPLSDDDESDDDDASTSSDEGSDSESDEMERKGYTFDAEETEKREVGKFYSRRYDTNGWNPNGDWKAVKKGDGELVARMKISRE